MESAGRIKNSLLFLQGLSGERLGDFSSSGDALVVSIASAVAEGRPSIIATTLMNGSAKSANPEQCVSELRVFRSMHEVTFQVASSGVAVVVSIAFAVAKGRPSIVATTLRGVAQSLQSPNMCQ